MMGQYLRLKASQPGAILFFRLGDFYEMFAEDAEQAAPILDIALTKRNGVPMCGVPHHAAQTYLTKLLRAGRKVAVCEQVGLPEGGLTERRVVEVVTPGTIVDERLLDHASNNYLAALADGGAALALAWADLSTGELRATRLPPGQTELWLRDHMQRLAPRELIVQESLLDAGSPAERVLAERPDLVLNRYPDWHFDADGNHEILCRQFGVIDLRSFGLGRTDAEVRAAGALVGFIRQHALHDAPHLDDLVVEAVDAHLRIDEPTQRNLELTANLLDGGREHTLLATLDRTRTAVGARLLRRSILAPLRDRDSIERRLDDVEALFRDQALLSRLRAELDRFRDLERLTARSSLGRSDARELLAYPHLPAVRAHHRRAPDRLRSPAGRGTPRSRPPPRAAARSPARSPVRHARRHGVQGRTLGGPGPPAGRCRGGRTGTCAVHGRGADGNRHRVRAAEAQPRARLFL